MLGVLTYKILIAGARGTYILTGISHRKADLGSLAERDIHVGVTGEGCEEHRSTAASFRSIVDGLEISLPSHENLGESFTKSNRSKRNRSTEHGRLPRRSALMKKRSPPLCSTTHIQLPTSTMGTSTCMHT